MTFFLTVKKVPWWDNIFGMDRIVLCMYLLGFFTFALEQLKA